MPAYVQIAMEDDTIASHSVSHTSGYLIGVGDGSVRNRYCSIAFGSLINQQAAHFLEVDGQRCFPASDFPRGTAH